MNSKWEIAIGLFCIITGIALAAWLGGYVMLYKGIASAIAHPNAKSILLAVFWGAGTIPGSVLAAIGMALLSK